MRKKGQSRQRPTTSQPSASSLSSPSSFLLLRPVSLLGVVATILLVLLVATGNFPWQISTSSSSSSFYFFADSNHHDASPRPMSESQSSSASNSNNKKIPKFLYIVTSGGQIRRAGQNDNFAQRFRQNVQPILLRSIKDLIRDNFCELDVYLVLSFDLPSDEEDALRQAIPKGVGLEIWTDATPYGISCKFNDDNSCMIQREGENKRYGTRTEARLQKGGAQLARQHRYVVKDKLPYYDFFLAFEDDMLIKQSHVKQYTKWMDYIRKLQKQAPDSNFVHKAWETPLTKQQLMRFRPGFIRVEALPKNGNHRAVQDESTFAFNASNVHLDPNHCCYTEEEIIANSNSLFGGASTIQPHELMVWETSLLGQSVRSLGPLPKSKKQQKKMNSTWVSLLAVQPHWLAPPGLWAGDMMTPRPPYQRRDYHGAKNLAQSAGWMGSQRDIMEYHTSLCKGGFLPPWDEVEYKHDGWGNNVEFWSGGIQLWAVKCSIQRFLPLHEFDKHLLYHTSNNKQNKMPKERMIRVQNMLGDLQYMQQHAMELLAD